MGMKKNSSPSLWSAELILPAMIEGLKKLNPKEQLSNPVMFVVWISSTVLTIALFFDYNSFNLQVALWLWLTLWFANVAESIAEGRSKAQADSLRKTKVNLFARKLNESGVEEKISAAELNKGDLVVCETGDLIPSDGDVVEGIATVDESVITGESAPVIRESGGDRSAVTGGTTVLSDRIVICISAIRGQTFLDKMIGLVENAKRQRTPNEIALSILLICLTIVFVLVVFTLPAMLLFPAYSATSIGITSLFALLVCLIPTTIGGLLTAIGISGMDRLLKHNVLAMSGKAIEAAGDVDILLLDKTGTITLGNRQAVEFYPASGISMEDMAQAASISSLADETPEGRSIVILAKDKHGIRGQKLVFKRSAIIPFSAETKMSGVDIIDESGDNIQIRKGASEAMVRYAQNCNINMPEDVLLHSNQVSKLGGTPLIVASNKKVYGLIYLKDIVKEGIKERFIELRKMGIHTVMVTGDNPQTAATIAAEAGVDDFIAQAKPIDKLNRIIAEQEKGHLVAMMGDGTNDAPALAQADVGVAMNNGTQAARESGNMVDLDNNPTKLIEIVEIGKQLLMTRGSLTTFSLANDVAKYFAIIPAIFIGLMASAGEQGPLASLNLMSLHSAESAILSAVIFNALIIVALIPLALKGIAYKPQGAGQVLRRNLLIYGVGGLISPFIGIKLIDMAISALGLA